MHDDVRGTLGVMMALCSVATAGEVDMAEVRRLAQEPVETIFAGAPIGRISAATCIEENILD